MITTERYTGSSPERGFVEGMPEQRYHAHPAISKSGLDLVAKSPAHFKHGPEREPTAAMNIGTAIHLALLEPERFEVEYVVCDVKDRRQAAYKAAVEEHGVERVLLPHEAANVRSIQQIAFDRPEVSRLLSAPGWSELSAFADDPETGVSVRCRYDRIAAAGFAVDLKKSRDVFPHGFARSVAAYRYHVQVAFYSDIFTWITGARLREFWLLAIEEQAPYTIVPYRLDDLAIEAGRLAYRRDLNTYAECLATGEWPLFAPESNLLALPNWALAELEDGMELAA